MRQGLLLIDIQNDYFIGGAMQLVGMEAAATQAAYLLQTFRRRHAPVFYLQHINTRPAATFFVRGTPGADINPVVTPRAGETVVEKHFPNGFRDTDLETRLRDAGIGELVICGAMSHMCVDATTRAASDLDFACQVVEDACATRDLQRSGRTVRAADVHAAFMAALAAAYAKVLPAKDFQFAT
ncbi:MAG TPA: cysteine hydrolase family protein [Nevskiaceae bacterium]|nr:cysteine hydrolase family protein [Nevskiaceae bacterium]